MPEIDPQKVVEMFEHLFGQKLGRWLAQALLALIIVTGAIWLLHICWEYAGKGLYESLSFPSIKLPSFDSLQTVVLTMMFMLVVYSVILLGILYFFMQRVFKRSVPKKVLDQLAELRSKAIHEILNAKVTTDIEYEAWKTTDNNWCEDVLRVLKDHFQKYEVLGFERLGIIPPVFYPHGFNNDHVHRLMMFSKRLTILEGVISRYSR